MEIPSIVLLIWHDMRNDAFDSMKVACSPKFDGLLGVLASNGI